MYLFTEKKCFFRYVSIISLSMDIAFLEVEWVVVLGVQDVLKLSRSLTRMWRKNKKRQFCVCFHYETLITWFKVENWRGEIFFKEKKIMFCSRMLENITNSQKRQYRHIHHCSARQKKMYSFSLFFSCILRYYSHSISNTYLNLELLFPVKKPVLKDVPILHRVLQW